MKLELPEYRYCPRCGAEVKLQNKEGRKRPVCSSCGHIIYVNPIPAAALVVINEGNILLTLRKVEPQKGQWCLPGGFLEWGESPEEGGKRELLEETGITAGSLSLLGVYASVTDVKVHVIVIAYQVITWSGVPVAGDDASDVRWFAINSIPPLAFSVHERALADMKSAIQK